MAEHDGSDINLSLRTKGWIGILAILLLGGGALAFSQNKTVNYNENVNQIQLEDKDPN